MYFCTRHLTPQTMTKSQLVPPRVALVSSMIDSELQTRWMVFFEGRGRVDVLDAVTGSTAGRLPCPHNSDRHTVRALPFSPRLPRLKWNLDAPLFSGAFSREPLFSTLTRPTIAQTPCRLHGPLFSPLFFEGLLFLVVAHLGQRQHDARRAQRASHHPANVLCPRRERQPLPQRAAHGVPQVPPRCGALMSPGAVLPSPPRCS